MPGISCQSPPTIACLQQCLVFFLKNRNQKSKINQYMAENEEISEKIVDPFLSDLQKSSDRRLDYRKRRRRRQIRLGSR